MPVSADMLQGDKSSDAIGSTSVTARIELPENTLDNEENVNTGDDTKLVIHISMLLLSGSMTSVLIINRNRILKNQRAGL